MLRNHVLQTFCVIIVFTQPLFSAPITMEIQFYDEKSPCWKYTKNGLEYLEIKYARLVQYGGDKKSKTRQVAGNVVCKPSSLNGHTMKFKCNEGQKGTDDMAYTTILAVTAKKQMLSGQINYRYDENAMNLVKNKFLDVDNLDEQSFDPSRHIAIKRIDIKGLKTKDLSQDFGECQESYPKRLIADHGIYMSTTCPDCKREYHWVRTYFDPIEMGEAMGWE